ncbi:hypothetical protein GN244_ATG02985 [Phytophthora infestans]|uniref:Uncharacterized protein n=1 Tax=Phytophthora infestans TaxID=4787 RepID=A0A833T240_PHYIN|nr:hypothetical protein GN244_ATG02985 [Phytophthora infestans]KAF4148044.1 hypothetical protein GN958_ATG02738 [Phytophthora infestans]
MMSSEEYEVLYTVRSELAKKGISPGVFGAPGHFGPGGCGGPGPWGFRPWSFGPGAWAFGGAGPLPSGPGGRRGGSFGWMKDVTPAEMGVLMKYREKGRERAALGGIIGASAMAGVWKAAALGSFLRITGMIVGGAIGARVSVRTSGIRLEMMSEMIKLPSERSPRAAQAREIPRTKLLHNAFAQNLLNRSEP